jgi:hypothetical protein
LLLLHLFYIFDWKNKAVLIGICDEFSQRKSEAGGIVGAGGG